MLGGGQVYLGDPQTGCAPPGPCYTRPNQAFTNINNRGSEGFSHYNALNVRYQTQDLMKTGLTIVANYTWAHSLDNGSSTFSESSSSSMVSATLAISIPEIRLSITAIPISIFETVWLSLPYGRLPGSKVVRDLNASSWAGTPSPGSLRPGTECPLPSPIALTL